MTPQERLRAALRHTDENLHLENGRVIVCGVNDAGEEVQLGSVDYCAGFTKGFNTRAAVDRVLFGPHRSLPPSTDTPIQEKK